MSLLSLLSRGLAVDLARSTPARRNLKKVSIYLYRKRSAGTRRPSDNSDNSDDSTAGGLAAANTRGRGGLPIGGGYGQSPRCHAGICRSRVREGCLDGALTVSRVRRPDHAASDAHAGWRSDRAALGGAR
jgi:hypothetical protein